MNFVQRTAIGVPIMVYGIVLIQAHRTELTLEEGTFVFVLALPITFVFVLTFTWVIEGTDGVRKLLSELVGR